ncbi:hypothetical protein ACF1E8_40325, partial [Streptomyces sp. NPDC014685]
RAAGAVTFNVLTTVFTGGAGTAASGAGKAGAVAKALSVAGKTGKFIDPMTYITKGAGTGLSKIGDITQGLKGIGTIDIPKLPDNAITLPNGSTMLPDGTFHLPDGAKVPDGGIELPNGNVKFPDDAPVLPEGTTKLPTAADDPIQYVDRDGNLLDKNGDIVQHAKDAPTENTPTTPHTDTPVNSPAPHTSTPVREPALAGVGARNGDDVIRLGSDPTGLGDLGRTGDNLPGGNVGDNIPTGQVGDNLPGGRTDDLGHGPTNSHEPPNTHTSGSGHTDGPGPNPHPNDGGHSNGGGHQDPPPTGGHGNDGPGGNGHNDGPDNGGPGNDGPGNDGSPTGGDHTPDNTGNHGDGPNNGGDGQAPDSPHGGDGTPEPIRVGDDPLPSPGPGEKVLGDLPEHRVRRTEDGLISHVDDRPVSEFLDQLSHQRAEDYLKAKNDETFPRSQTGACVGSVIDLRTGRVIEGINGPKKAAVLIPMDRLHPTLLERYEQIADAPPHHAPILAHAEVKAANELLWARKELGLPDDASALAELRASVQFPYMADQVTGKPPRPAPFCGNCNHMLEGVPSSFGRFLKDPPGPENWIP